MSNDTPKIPLKLCRKCGIEKPATAEYFYRDKYISSGFKAGCKECLCASDRRKDNLSKATIERRELASRGLKRCNRCKQSFPATTEYFYPAKAGSFGVYNCCIPCVNKRSSEYRKTPIGIQSHRESQNRYYHRNAPMLRILMRKMRKDIPEYFNTVNRAWYAKNLEVGRLSSRIRAHRRRAKNTSVELYSNEDVMDLVRLQKDLCWWCGKSLNGVFEIDHRIPIDRGGADNLSNIVLAHQFCNRSKHNKMPWEWNGRLL